ncbi:hypothetical protein NECAME_15233 [Necator americanus]|uniref:Uncharacterized protein n=1 Tax=Necator americanus TaxID=51031 RepID=W2SIS3_NECAM|nr:hypothetical protein NECAME_15233 [Necator americanus]ETN69559.1 hypothetical protein NECAME_15233 [Necator americanus]
MAKHGNILTVDLVTVITMINVHNKDTLVLGKANNVLVSQKLDVARMEAYDGLRRKSNNVENVRVEDPEVTVKGISAQVDDEIVSHLAAFALDEEAKENNVNLFIKVCDSRIQIHVG